MYKILNYFDNVNSYGNTSNRYSMAYQSYLFSKLNNQSKYLNGTKFPVEIYTNTQRQLLIIILKLIIKNGRIDDVSLKMKNKIIELMKDEFEIDNKSFQFFNVTFDIDGFSNHLLEIKYPQSELFLLYVHEILTCNGKPTDHEYKITLRFLKKFFNLSQTQYHNCLDNFKLSGKDCY